MYAAGEIGPPLLACAPPSKAFQARLTRFGYRKLEVESLRRTGHLQPEGFGSGNGHPRQAGPPSGINPCASGSM